jgi:hypothetical protein
MILHLNNLPLVQTGVNTRSEVRLEDSGEESSFTDVGPPEGHQINPLNGLCSAHGLEESHHGLRVYFAVLVRGTRCAVEFD